MLPRQYQRVVALPKRQRGNALVFTLLGLAITAIAAASTLQAKRVQQKRDAGTAEATVLDGLRNGVNIAIFEQLVTLQRGNALSKNGYTVSPTAVGADLVWQPSIAALVGMGYLPAGWTTTQSSLNSAPYTISFQRVPTGCAPADCGIEGRILIAGAIRDTNIAGQVDSVVIGPILTRLGADSGVSLQASPTRITGFGLTWSTTNPVSGQPPGVVAVRVGTTSGTWSQFVRIQDTRDPDLQGKLTVAGDVTLRSALTVGTTVTAAGDIGTKAAAGACLRAALTASGDVLSRAADCVARFKASPDGTASVMAADGTVRARLVGDTGGVEARDAAGAVTASLDGTDGRAGGQRLNASLTALANASCAGSQEGDIVKDAASDGTVLSCRGGVWRRPGLPLSSVGAACSSDGGLGVDASGRGLICRSSQWRLMNDRIGSMVAMANYLGSGFGYVPASSCGAGGVPDLTATPRETGADYAGIPPRNRFTLSVTWSGFGWYLDPVLQDENGGRSSSSYDGGSYNFGWSATTYCTYPGG